MLNGCGIMNGGCPGTNCGAGGMAINGAVGKYIGIIGAGAPPGPVGKGPGGICCCDCGDGGAL